MHRADPRAACLESAFELHEATRVTRHDRIDAERLQFVDIVVGHAGRDAGEIHAEGAAEAAAAVAGRRLDEFQSGDCGEQPPRFVADAEFAESVAGVVLGDAARPARAEVGEAEPPHEERSEFHGRARHPGGGLGARVVARGTQQFDRMPEHRDA